MALILRNGGSQSPDRWLREPRNNHHTLRAGKFAVYHENQWYELEGYILDIMYLRKLQNKNKKCTGTFCGYGVAVKDFQNPTIDFNRNNTYIQSEGITQDFGIYDSPDDLLQVHHQEMSAVKAFMYKHLGRHLMNRNVKKIRNL
jgi:hypothetical protein